MSLLKTNSVQIGQSATATQNFTLAVPSSPDGTIKLARGNNGATTQDVLGVNASGQITATITGSTITGSTITSSTISGGSITQATAQNASSTAIDFTGIPNRVKRITVMFNGVSLSGSSEILVQIGSTTFSTSGYNSISNETNQANSTAGATSAAGFIVKSGLASQVLYGILTIANISSNTWVSSHAARKSATNACFGGGNGSTSGTLDRIRITTANGTDTFDAGSVNIMYE
jgi:hypothetical protein